MGKPKKDALAAALDAVQQPNQGGQVPKMLRLFGDRPEVLEAVVRARRERHLSWRQIAETLTAAELAERGEQITEHAIQTYCRSQGVR